MDLDEGNSFLGAFEGVGPEISTFWAQMALATLVAHPNPYIPPHINNGVHLYLTGHKKNSSRDTVPLSKYRGVIPSGRHCRRSTSRRRAARRTCSSSSSRTG
jgi:hypothetical protein